MKKLLLLCVGVLAIGIVVGCTNTNSMAKIQFSENSKEALANQTIESNFGEKEIIEFLLEADNYARESVICEEKQTKRIIGKMSGSLIYEYDMTDHEVNSVLKRLEKYFSPKMAIWELNKSGIFFVNNRLGYIQGCLSEMLLLSEKSKIELVVDEENKKVIKVEKFHPMILENLENNKSEYNYNQYWEEYTICNNNEGGWIVVDENAHGKSLSMGIESVFDKWERIESSSNLKGYSAEKIIDQNGNTAWVEGVNGNGEGEWINLISKKKVEVSSIQIRNGYKKSENLYYENNRAKKIKIEFSNGDSHIIELEDSDNDQWLYMNSSIKTNYVKLTILEVYEGSKYEDTCISDIIIYTKEKTL